MPAYLPALPAVAPRKGNRFTRWLGVRLLAAMGWRVEGEFPHCAKLIIAAAPHTSNWDFILAMLAILALGLRASYLMKKEAFIWPFAGLFKWLGGVPVVRSHADGMTQGLVGWFAAQESAWLLITPEGTRQKVEKYKTGFLRVSAAADVPVMLVAWDYPTKRIVLEKIWTQTHNHEADCAAIRQYLNNRYQARHPKWQ